MGEHMVRSLEQNAVSFKKLCFELNYINALMGYILLRLIPYNLALVDNTDCIVFMEDILEQPEKLVGLLGGHYKTRRDLMCLK